MTHLLRLFAISSSFFIAAPILLAEPALVVTFASLPERIRAQNPDLAAARIRIREARARADQSGRRSNPELQVSVEHNRDYNEGRVELGLSQRFPVTDRLRREKSLTQAQVAIAENEVRVAEFDLISQARMALIEVLTIRERRGLLEQQTKVTNELAESIGQAAAKGEASPLDAGQARIETLRVVTESRQLDAKETLALAPLKILLGMNPSQKLAVGCKLPPVTLVTGGATIRRPDLETARLEIESAAQEIGIEETKRYDDIEAGIMVALDRTEDRPYGRETEGMFGFQMKIPLPFWNKNEGGIAEAAARHERKTLEHRALKRTISLQAASTSDEMREWAALIEEISNKLLPVAEEQSTTTETAWRNGQTTLQSVLKAREQRLQLAVSRIDAIREFHLASARHQAATGSF